MSKPQSVGGKTVGKLRREAALKAYYANPNFCEHCAEVISVGEHQKVCIVRSKRFCGQSCAAKFNNTTTAFPKRKRTPKVCVKCGERHATTRPRQDGSLNYNKLCADCHVDKYQRLAEATKSESSHSQIRGHARKVMKDAGLSCLCAVPGCDYTHFAECCHRTPVKDFPPDTKLKDMNSVDNLVALCPNHHWDFDHGLLTLS